MATDLTIARVVQAGAMPIDTYAVPAELMRTWHRPDAMECAAVMVDHIVPLSDAERKRRQGAERAEGRARNAVGPPGDRPDVGASG